MKLKLLLLSGLLYLSSLSYSQTIPNCTFGSVSFTQSGAGLTKTCTANTTLWGSLSYTWKYNGTTVGSGATQNFTYSTTGPNMVCLNVVKISWDSLRMAWDTCQLNYCDTLTHSTTPPPPPSGPCTGKSLTVSYTTSGASATFTANHPGYSSSNISWYNGSTFLGNGTTYTSSFAAGTHIICAKAYLVIYDSLRFPIDTCIHDFCDTVYITSGGPCSSFIVDAGPDTICTSSGIYTVTLGGSPSVTGGTPNYVYVWSYNSTNSSLSSTAVSNPVATVWSGYSTFILTVYDSLGCVKNDTVVIDTNCSRTISLKENNTVNSLKIFPNPANNNITISYNSTISTNGNIQVTDLIGKIVLNKGIEFNSNSKSEEKINISNLSKGSYLVRIIDNKNGNYISKPIRFVKQ